MSAKNSTERHVGKVFGRLTILGRFRGTDNRFHFRCRCECGNETTPTTDAITSGHSRSCGCLQKEGTDAALRTHSCAGRGKHTPEYRTWVQMKRRCYSSKHSHFHLYGGRGIKVCERWLESFEAFLADMGQRPSSKHSIDRFPDQNGNYEPGNCRWATSKEQTRNQRSNVMITINGRTMCLQDWATETGINYPTLSYRVRSGWSAEKILSRPDRGRARRSSS